jgi:hypothetical protein
VYGLYPYLHCNSLITIKISITIFAISTNINHNVFSILQRNVKCASKVGKKYQFLAKKRSFLNVV